MPNINIQNLIYAALIVLIMVTFMGRRRGFGPIHWIKRASGRKRAEEGIDRKRLVAQVQQLLPQANDDNVLFSVHEESSTSGGSQIKVTTYTYEYWVYVVEGKNIWVIPFSNDRSNKTYALGQPALLTKEMVRQVKLTGKPNKNLTYTFAVDTGSQIQNLSMTTIPFCYRINSFYPLTLFQANACTKAIAAAEQLALAACGTTPEELERGRLKDQCLSLTIYACCTGFLGILFATAELLPMVIASFVAALAMFVLVLIKGQIPKISAIVLLVEGIISYLILRP